MHVERDFSARCRQYCHAPATQHRGIGVYSATSHRAQARGWSGTQFQEEPSALTDLPAIDGRPVGRRDERNPSRHPGGASGLFADGRQARPDADCASRGQPVNLEPIEMSDGGLLFRQHIEPLPFAMRDWQVYLRQRNSKAAENMRCTLDPARPNSLAISPSTNAWRPRCRRSTCWRPTRRASAPNRPPRCSARSPGVRSAHQAHAGVRAAALLLGRITNLNAAYVVINAAIKDVGFPVIFNSLTQGGA